MNAGDFVSGTAPIDVELFRVVLLRSGAFRVELRFDDDSYLYVDFEPESDGHRRIVDALTRSATRTLSNLGATGVVIVGMTAPLADDDEEES